MYRFIFLCCYSYFISFSRIQFFRCPGSSVHCFCWCWFCCVWLHSSQITQSEWQHSQCYAQQMKTTNPRKVQARCMDNIAADALQLAMAGGLERVAFIYIYINISVCVFVFDRERNEWRAPSQSSHEYRCRKGSRNVIDCFLFFSDKYYMIKFRIVHLLTDRFLWSM